jgi:Apea-like HEPN
MHMTTAITSLDELKQRWQPTKDRLNRASKGQTNSGHPLAVRVHRAFSWLEAAENSSAEVPDVRLILSWIGFNALYGSWNSAKGEPEPDFFTLKKFVSLILAIDKDNVLPDTLCIQRPRIANLFHDRFVSDYYWKTIGKKASFSVERGRYLCDRLFAEKKWLMLLDELFQRIYLVRCQLVHGASTHGSSLNRKAVAESAGVIDQLLRSTLRVVIDHGLGQNWDNLCYPPINSTTQPEPLHSQRPR